VRRGAVRRDADRRPQMPDRLGRLPGRDQIVADAFVQQRAAGIGRERALSMAQAARAVGREGAAGAFVDACEEAVRAA